MVFSHLLFNVLYLPCTFQINVPTDVEGTELLAEKVDRRELIDLLKNMLMLDQERRITPNEALNHPFQTLSHLREYTHCMRSVLVPFHLPPPL